MKVEVDIPAVRRFFLCPRIELPVTWLEESFARKQFRLVKGYSGNR